MEARLDHLVVTAATLAQGVAYVHAALGVSPRPGGRHPRMGTHNCLLRLGPATYLEVIAVDPEAPPPELPRWFGLDRAGSAPPRLAAWVARTGDLEGAVRACPDYGRIEPMTRGALRWAITLPDRGALVGAGIAPLLIQWGAGPHPAAGLEDQGCSLAELRGFHPDPAEITGLLGRLGCDDEIRVALPPPGQGPGLVAHIRTPTGLHALGRPGASLG